MLDRQLWLPRHGAIAHKCTAKATAQRYCENSANGRRSEELNRQGARRAEREN
jgi:hypothetical protein